MTQRTTRALATICITLLASCNGSNLDTLLPVFRVELSELANDTAEAGRLAYAGLDGWHFLNTEFQLLALDSLSPTRPSTSPSATPITDAYQAILDLKRQLDARNVELLLVPIPPKAVVFPEKITSALDIPIPVPRLDPALVQFYDRLREEHVEVLDLTALFLRERFHPEGPLYCRTDSHLSGSGCTVAAAAIATAIRSRPWYETLETEAFGAAWYSTTVMGNLIPNPGTTTDREEIRFRGIVSYEDGRPSPVSPTTDSPIVLLGDSQALVFHASDDPHVTGAGLADQLAFELGIPLDVVATRDPETFPDRQQLHERSQANATYWDGKRIVIWCFLAHRFAAPQDWPLVAVHP